MAKLLCRSCRDRFRECDGRRIPLGFLCNGCLEGDRPRRASTTVDRSRKSTRKGHLEVSIREEVDARDGGICRACGRGPIQRHHIRFRSHGGPNEAWNLISLCVDHHGGWAHGPGSREVRAQLFGVLYEFYANDRFIRAHPEVVADEEVVKLAYAAWAMRHAEAAG